MKKLLLSIVAAAAFLFVVTSCATIEQSKIDLARHDLPRGAETEYFGYVREIIVTVESNGETTEHKEYSIYIGNEETELKDERVAMYGIMAVFRLFHPLPEVEMPFEADHRWYAELLDNRTGFHIVGPVFDPEVWASLPIILKHILFALDYTDDDLLLIQLEILTGSISIHYHPDYDRNVGFYNRKFRILKKYFDTTDVNEDISIEVSESIVNKTTV